MKNPVLLVVIIIALVAFTAWYFSKPTDTMVDKTALTPTPTVQTKTIPLTENNESGQTGTATFQADGDKTKVTLSMVGGDFNTPQPAHIHLGQCPKPGSVKYPLTNVVDGQSETVITVDMDTLFSELPLALNVHKSVEEASFYTACGDLK